MAHSKTRTVGMPEVQATVDVSAIQQELETSQRHWIGQRLQWSNIRIQGLQCQMNGFSYLFLRRMTVGGAQQQAVSGGDCPVMILSFLQTVLRETDTGSTSHLV